MKMKMKPLSLRSQLMGAQYHDETIKTLSEDNCLFIIGICFSDDNIRHIYNLGSRDKHIKYSRKSNARI